MTLLAAVLTAVLPLIAGPSEAAVSPDYTRDEYWFPRAVLPCFARAEARRVVADDLDAVNAEIEGWITEYKGTANLRPSAVGRSWVLPVSELKRMDEFLATLGRVRRLPGRRPEYPFSIEQEVGESESPFRDVRMIDRRLVVSQRDALRRELDGMAGRAPGLPAIAGLTSAYATALDEIADALERYESVATVDIAVTDREHELRSESGGGQVQPEMYLFPGGCMFSRWDEVRVPPFGRMTDDYMGWSSVGMPWLEFTRSISIQLLVPDADSAAPELEKDLVSHGASIPAVGPAVSRRKSIPPWGRPGVVKGYWVPRKRLDEAKTVIAKHGRVVVSSRNRSPGGDAARSAAAAWAEKLGGELRGEEDRLTPYPHIQGLITAHLRRLRGTMEMAQRFEDDELLEVKLVTVSKGGDAASTGDRSVTAPVDLQTPFLTTPASLPSGPPPPPMPTGAPDVRARR